MTYHWSPRRSGPDQLPNAAMSRLPTQEARKASVEVTLFDIEKDGDPRISWYMYYDFIVTKNEAYYQLQPGYLPTETFPRRRKSEPVTINKGERRHLCRVPHCTVDPFPRHSDLERHFKSAHENSRDESCDYAACGSSSGARGTTGRSGPSVFRLDKIQDHYRDQHNEDLLRPNDDAAKVEKFLAQKVGGGLVSLAWWRCSRCKQRVMVREDDYQCPRCKLLCEPERAAWRRSMVSDSAGGAYGGGVENAQRMEVEGYSEDSF